MNNGFRGYLALGMVVAFAISDGFQAFASPTIMGIGQGSGQPKSCAEAIKSYNSTRNSDQEELTDENLDRVAQLDLVFVKPNGGKVYRCPGQSLSKNSAMVAVILACRGIDLFRCFCGTSFLSLPQKVVDRKVLKNLMTTCADLHLPFNNECKIKVKEKNDCSFIKSQVENMLSDPADEVNMCVRTRERTAYFLGIAKLLTRCMPLKDTDKVAFEQCRAEIIDYVLAPNGDPGNGFDKEEYPDLWADFLRCLDELSSSGPQD